MWIVNCKSLIPQSTVEKIEEFILSVAAFWWIFYWTQILKRQIINLRPLHIALSWAYIAIICTCKGIVFLCYSSGVSRTRSPIREGVKGILSKLAEKSAQWRYQGNTCISNEQNYSFNSNFTCDSKMEPFVNQCVERMFHSKKTNKTRVFLPLSLLK